MLPRLSVIFSVSLLLALAVQPALMAQEQTAPKSDSIKSMVQNADRAVQQKTPTESAATGDAKPAADTGAGDTATAQAGGNQDNGDDSVKKDIILVLDNSGSMRKNDPKFLTSKAVTDFIGDLDASTRLAVIVFDQDVNLVVPLTPVTQSNRGVLLKSLDRINYRGLFTDSPAAIERAIYELKNNGRPGAKKLIVFMTDGIVDTGNPQEDRSRTKWLVDSLAPDAAKAGIKIFGIAFTEKADFQLIQSLAQVTGGEYYRVLRAEDLSRVFRQIKAIINKKPAPVHAAVSQPAATTPAPQKPVVIEIPRQPVTAMDREERIRSIIMITAAAVLILAVLAILVLLLKRGRGLKLPADYVTEAYVNDIHGYTGHPSYKLGSKPTMLGRVAGMDNEHLDYIVVPESTIGRRHSLIEYKDYAYWIVDQGSINGTFVNDVPITSEVRLKHGDRIRLHKYEFEFVMPEMGDAGKTVISQTVLASRAPEMEEATELRGAGGEGFDLDFDLSGEGATTDVGDSTIEEKLDFDSEDETLMPGSDEPAASQPDGSSVDQEEDYGSEDVTLMPDLDSEEVTPPKGTPIEQRREGESPEEDTPDDDETIMPSDFDLPEDDATIRKDTGTDDDFLDISGPGRRDQ